MKLCECGCGNPAPIATRNWHCRGVVKGQPLRFICGHHRRGMIQSKAEKEKRVKAWGTRPAAFSPYLPNNKVVRFSERDRRWFCSMPGRSVPHAKVVYEHFYDKVPDGFVVHHKNGKHDTLEDDRPENLMLLSKTWNRNFLPYLARDFGVPESIVTDCYLIASSKQDNDNQIFRDICQMLIEKTEEVTC